MSCGVEGGAGGLLESDEHPGGCTLASDGADQVSDGARTDASALHLDDHLAERSLVVDREPADAVDALVADLLRVRLGVDDVRQGKYIELDLGDTDQAKARARVDEMCKQLLANTVIENYSVEIG